MKSSETISKISAALLKAQTEMGNAKKDSINPFYKKSYADLNSIREATLPALNANGISAIQPTCVIDGMPYVETILLHESGEYISSFTQIITDKPNDAQRHGSGLSYARRYALQSICNVGAEDDDAEKAVTKNGAEKNGTAIQKEDPEKSQRNLNSYIAKLANCNDVDELKVLKSITPSWVLATKEFTNAATKRFTEVAKPNLKPA